MYGRNECTSVWMWNMRMFVFMIKKPRLAAVNKNEMKWNENFNIDCKYNSILLTSNYGILWIMFGKDLLYVDFINSHIFKILKTFK